jgi:glucose-1-phosphate adenylyltransferase
MGKGMKNNMIATKDCVALLLAGGEGRRLGSLTRHMAKPAVPFGGKYRIVDFTLSNCSNSGIQSVGVLTQYKPQTLNSHIGQGSPWGLNGSNGGVTILSPFVKGNGEQYKGTADAVYQNIDFIDRYAARRALVVSGDHIYKMDYSRMLQYHKNKQADVTIAAIEVPWTEAGRFGILNTSSDGRLTEFEEKPQTPRSNLASMGVYIFRTDVLKEHLEMDRQNMASSHDFGKDVIPRMLFADCRMFAYIFKGYWKDVGTVESYWEANMELLKDKPGMDLHDQSWPIYTVEANQLPQGSHLSARGNHSLVNEDCKVLGQADHSILFPGVQIGKNSVVRDSIIMAGATIGEEVILERAIVGEHAVIGNRTCLSGSNEAIVVVDHGDVPCNPLSLN